MPPRIVETVVSACSVCMDGHHKQVDWVLTGRVIDRAHGQLNRGMIFLCPHVRLRSWSRDTDSTIPSRILVRPTGKVSKVFVAFVS